MVNSPITSFAQERGREASDLGSMWGNIFNSAFPQGQPSPYGLDPQTSLLRAQLEQAYGGALPITSGHRTPEHNAAVGGANQSQHLTGSAFDIYDANMSQADKLALLRAASEAGATGFGIYDDGSLHFDTRTGQPAAWGSDYTSGSVPDWAADTVASILTGKTPTGAIVSTKNEPENVEAVLGGMLDEMYGSAQDQGADKTARRKAIIQGIGVGLSQMSRGQTVDLSGVQANYQQGVKERAAARRARTQAAQAASMILSQTGDRDMAAAVASGAISYSDVLTKQQMGAVARKEAALLAQQAQQRGFLADFVRDNGGSEEDIAAAENGVFTNVTDWLTVSEKINDLAEAAQLEEDQAAGRQTLMEQYLASDNPLDLATGKLMQADPTLTTKDAQALAKTSLDATAPEQAPEAWRTYLLYKADVESQGGTPLDFYTYQHGSDLTTTQKNYKAYTDSLPAGETPMSFEDFMIYKGPTELQRDFEYVNSLRDPGDKLTMDEFKKLGKDLRTVDQRNYEYARDNEGFAGTFSDWVSPKNGESESEARIRRFEEVGLPHDIAVGIVQGQYQIDTNGYVVDLASRAVTQLPSGNQDALPSTGETILTPGDKQPSDYSLWELSESSTGPSSTLSMYVARGSSLVGLDSDQTAEYARTRIETAKGSLIRALSINPRFPVGEIERLEKAINITPGMFTSGDVLRSRMVAVDDYLKQRIADEQAVADDSSASGASRRDAEAAVRDMEAFREKLGVPDQGYFISAETDAASTVIDEAQISRVMTADEFEIFSADADFKTAEDVISRLLEVYPDLEDGEYIQLPEGGVLQYTE